MHKVRVPALAGRISSHMPPTLSQRVRSLKPSATVAMANRVKALRREGVEVLAFAAGEPDFDTPTLIKDAAIEALRGGATKYAPTLGPPDAREAIADKLTRDNGIPGLTRDHVAISVGAKHSFFLAAHCLIDPPAHGETPSEAILPVPAWVSYAPILALAGAKVVEVPTTMDSGFTMSPEQLAAAITPRTRVIVLNSPCNPTGRMYTPEQLSALARVIDEGARRAPNLVVITDEIYEKIVYDGARHVSIASLPGMAERTVTINGMSKAFAMTGWRIGYAAASGDFGRSLITAFDTLQGQMTNNITSFVYPAIVAALTRCEADVERMRRAFATRAQLMEAKLRDIPGVRCARPMGAFYAFPDVSALFGRTSSGGRTLTAAADLAEALLEEERMAVVPGEEFGGCGARHVRLSFACGEAQIEEGAKRLARFVGGLT